jgi:shikimate dehydrogenase
VDVLVSTVPAAAQTEPVLALVEEARLVFEVVYDPWPTPLAAAAAAGGATVVSGAAMLLHQAAEQVRLMTGQDAPLEAMRAALRRRTQAV